MIYPHLSLYNVVNGGKTDGGENWQLRLIAIPQAPVEPETSACSSILNTEFQLPVPIIG